jgi:hypothetical protein
LKAVVSVMLPLIYIGWAIAAVRLVLEFVAPEVSLWFGVYYAMPVVYAFYGFRTERFKGWPWVRILLAAVVAGFAIWTIPNCIAYTLAQFMEWEHGRFSVDRSAPLQDSTLGKLLAGVKISLMTGLGGTVWSTVWMTLVVWLPGRFLKK